MFRNHDDGASWDIFALHADTPGRDCQWDPKIKQQLHGRSQKTSPHDRSVFGLKSLANTLTQEPQEARLNSKGHLTETLRMQKTGLDKKTGRWRQFGT